MHMKEKKVFVKAFGLNEEGLVDFPRKMSNVRIARIELGDFLGCAWCFPHQLCTGSSRGERIRNWKAFRKKQYKRKD